MTHEHYPKLGAAEVWTFDPLAAQWTLKEPDTSPPGVCCNAQNVYDPTTGRYIRFPFGPS